MEFQFKYYKEGSYLIIEAIPISGTPRYGYTIKSLKSGTSVYETACTNCANNILKIRYRTGTYQIFYTIKDGNGNQLTGQFGIKID